MLDSLSRFQKAAYDALELGPVWLSRDQPSEDAEVNALHSGENVALALVFKGSDLTRFHTQTQVQTQLLAQLLQSIGRNFESAHLLNIDALQAANRYELMLVFDAGSSDEIDAFMVSQGIRIECRVDLPSLAIIASEGKAKASAWKSLKKVLL
jgi:hypothetical protein